MRLSLFNELKVMAMVLQFLRVGLGEPDGPMGMAATPAGGLSMNRSVVSVDRLHLPSPLLDLFSAVWQVIHAGCRRWAGDEAILSVRRGAANGRRRGASARKSPSHSPPVDLVRRCAAPPPPPPPRPTSPT